MPHMLKFAKVRKTKRSTLSRSRGPKGRITERANKRRVISRSRRRTSRRI